MLRQLHITGLGVIQELDLEPAPGLTVLTGETGAGKTMITVGITLALGGRGSAQLVRGNWWRAASLLLFTTVIALLLGPLAGTLLLFVSHASFDFVNLVSSVVYAIVLPFAAIATTYLYFDLRVAKQDEAEVAETAEVLPVEAPSTGAVPTS